MNNVLSTPLPGLILITTLSMGLSSHTKNENADHNREDLLFKHRDGGLHRTDGQTNKQTDKHRDSIDWRDTVLFRWKSP